MADILNKDPATFEHEKQIFLKELVQFHETRGTPFKTCPKISGQNVDLFLLYTLVTSQGGWVKVNSRNEWDKVLQDMNIPTNCVNSSVAIKQVYLRYLDRYEKVHFLGEVGERVSEDDEDSRHRKWSMRALHSVPLNYNHNQHNVNESLREYNGLSIELYRPSEYDKLGLSLLSPLINEQDFAINVCTLLSNEGKHSLKLEKHPRILHYLLAHAAVFSHPNLRTLFTEHYLKVRGHSISRFWDDVLCESRLQRLIDESQFEASLEKLYDIDAEALLAASDKRTIIFQPEDKELFCLGRTLGTQDYIGQRVLQVATILRNLTFIQENLLLMKKDLTFLRFVLLCCGSRWNTLHQMGWDMLGNLALELTIQCPLMNDIIGMTVKGLSSTDRAEIVSSLEVLNKIGQNEKNEDFLLKYIDQSVYDRVCSFLTVHDIMLLIYTLECLNSLSSLGEKACNSILKVHGIIETLVSLITVEAQSYGPKACIQMRVVETVTGTSSIGVVAAGTPVAPTGPVAVVGPGVAAVSGGPARPSTPTLVATIPQACPPAPPALSLQQSVPATQLPLTPASPRVAATQPPTSSIHATQQVAQENEHFALAWLRSTFEPSSNGRVEQAELYKQYINYCAKIGRRGVIAPLHFPRCVRSVFGGSVGPKGASNSDSALQFYEGIQVRAKPLLPPNPSPSLPQTPSPILKAQLSAPPKPTPTTPQHNKVTQRQQQQKLLQQSQDSQVTEHHIASPVSSANNSVTHCIIPVTTVTSISSIVEKSPNTIVTSASSATSSPFVNKPVAYKINGVCSSLAENSNMQKENETDAETVVTSTSGENHTVQPPPLAPLSQTNCIKVSSSTEQELNENSLQSMLIAKTNAVSGENSCDSFSVNGMTNSNDTEENSGNPSIPKNLMLADLLEKHVDKSEPPVLNGSLRFSDRGLELVPGFEKDGLTSTSNSSNGEVEMNGGTSKEEHASNKRPGEELPSEGAKKPHLNGDVNLEEPPEEGNLNNGNVSSSAANLYAALAADALEDEPIEENADQTTEQKADQQAPVLMTSANQARILVAAGGVTQRVMVGGQHYVVTQPQTALVQGQTQTVLVAQTPQQQGTGAKTIIILQPQNVSSSGSQQKVLVQGLPSGAPPPLITSSPSNPSVRPKSPPKPPPTPPLQTQPLMPQNVVKTVPVTTVLSQNQLPPAPMGTVAMPVMPAPCATPVNLPITTSTVSNSSTISTPPSASSNSIEASSSSGPTEAPTQKPLEQGHFLCEWRGCMRNFKSGNEVYMHACEAHCPQGSQDIQCLWERCDAMKRKRYSHMTHLYDRHCNPDLMRIMAVRRKQLSTSGKTEIPPPTPAAPHPGYAPNAAFHAIKRHALEFVNPKELKQQRVIKPGPIPAPVQIEQDDNEGPVTKSIRLTAALILRNLVIYSTNGRRHMTRFEPHLANVALSTVESSRTISQVLYDISQPR